MINRDLKHFLDEWFASSELNLLHKNYGGGRIFSDPIIGVVKGDDSIIQEFKKVVGEEHLTPYDLWLFEGKREIPASDLSVVSIVFPYGDTIRNKSKNVSELSRIILPAEIYSVGRNYANAFKQETCRQVIRFLNERRYSAVAAMLSESFNILTKGRFYSSWSERHYAFAAGLGSFGLSEALITEAGCNVRFASIVTDAPLKTTPRKSDDPYANCLYYAKGICRKCQERCPANAIDENGHNKNKCYAYGQKISRKMNLKIGEILKPHRRHINGVWRDQKPPVGCAFCQFNVPCMDKNPVK